MKIAKTYSFNGGEEYIKTHHLKELQEVIRAVEQLNAVDFLTKESQEKTMRGKLLFSPVDINKAMKDFMCENGWTERKEGSKKGFKEPRHHFGGNRFREMDGIKNRVGLEIQFGKYAFMGYDIFSKMVIFNKLDLIDCGIEVVPIQAIVKQMSTGVSSFEQLLVDFEYRGVSNIDIPVLVIGMGVDETEQKSVDTMREMYRLDKSVIKKISQYSGALPGPKSSHEPS